MANIFTKSNDATPKPNRNTFDGSFVNNLTLKMGQITPCFCKEVIPGDSFRINPTFGFNFQPFVFPVQTDMQANLHFFYVRNRALWKGWMDFITKTENLEGDSTPPYIQLTSENRDMFETGKIGDYLGVPTMYYGQEYRTVTRYLSRLAVPNQYFYATSAFRESSGLAYMLDMANAEDVETLVKGRMANLFKYIRSEADNYGLYPLPWNVQASGPKSQYVSMYNRATILPYTVNLRITRNYLLSQVSSLLSYNTNFNQNFDDAYTSPLVIFAAVRKSDNMPVSVVTFESGSGQLINPRFYNAELTDTSGTYVSMQLPTIGEEYYLYLLTTSVISSTVGANLTQSSAVVTTIVDSRFGIATKDLTLSELPFASSDNPDGIRVSAMPFRAVEACYNAFYRDDRNNPLIIDGKPYYNVYVQDKNGGADTNHYHLYQRNWEADVFTTAVQSPQQGVAPLVGVTASGQMTFQDEEGKSYYLQAEIGEDGHTITGIKSYSSDMPVGTLRAMVDTISTGISINDFRNVNALQRWLETNMRKGLRYKDQIEAHYGTAPTYSELDMPEFIGGMSRRVEVNKVVQTSADTLNSPLGTLGGNATILGGNGSDISCYADEHGWIIGFITITPKPVYSQQLNKQLTKTQLLDYYFPEFAHIGFQPILNQEIAPLQCSDSDGNRLTDVFGYQRAWYEYLANVDEVHGDFRTSLKDYIIHRVFNGVPQLSEEFLTVSTDEANEVFAVNTDDDKIFGQIYFDVKMKRPLPTVGVPRLEVG